MKTAAASRSPRPHAAVSAALTAPLPRPGLLFGPYPQRPQPPALGWGLLGDLADLLGDGLLRRLRRWTGRGDAGFEAALRRARRAARSDTRPFAARLTQCRAELARRGLAAAPVAQAQMLVAQAVDASRGQRPYVHQHLAAWAMLQDRLVEMDTGEGKTLALLMAAATAALAGLPVHVVTANDYLAARDAQAARPVLDLLGLSTAALGPTLDTDARRRCHACDVVYGTAREFGFDHLRDLVREPGTAGPPLLRGLCLALIDEADSVLIDHAGTPLVIATPASTRAALALPPLPAVHAFAAGLRAGDDFELAAERRAAELAPTTVDRLMERLADARLDRRVCAHSLSQALVARHLLRRDRDYVVQTVDGRAQVVLVDPTTGRLLHGTHWTAGLHDHVALKEGCPPPPALASAAQISLQRLFSRYCKLGGISGTLRESCLELFLFYRLRVQRIEPRQPSRRRDAGLRVLADRAAQFDAVRASVHARRARGQPVLVGTDSIASADALAAHLQASGLRVTVLHARHDAKEAQRIARAGQTGAVTVTTNLAGRGTDIELDASARHAGLHVVACVLNRSRRIDRQLLGRAARQGQPGSCETVLSLDDDLFRRWLPARLRQMLARRAAAGGLPRPLAGALARGLQGAQAWADLLQRWQLVQHDRHSRQALGFTTRAE